jgi:hypothetical protein
MADKNIQEGNTAEETIDNSGDEGSDLCQSLGIDYL